MAARSALCVCALMILIVGAIPAARATHDPAMGVFVDQSFRVPFDPDRDTLATDVEFLDLDLDGDRDLYVTRGDLSGGPRVNVMFSNDGAGTFTSVVGASPVMADFTDVDFADVNGDGRVDAVLSVNLGIERLFFFGARKGGGLGFTNQAKRMPPGQPADVTIESQFFDADGDRDLDIITANEDPFTAPGAQNRLYLNNGTRFVDATANLPAILDDSSAFAIGDFDEDGDQDVITVNSGPFVYLDNDGTGHFSDQSSAHLPPQPTTQDSGRDAVVEDFDGDGDLDAIFAISRGDTGPLFLMNDGTGVFTNASANLPQAARGAQDVEACDIEGDGDLDVIEADSGRVLQPPTDHRFEGAQNRILVNDGSGHFIDVTAQHLPSVIDSSFSVACGDLTGDGRADLVVANGKGEPLRVYVQT